MGSERSVNPLPFDRISQLKLKLTAGQNGLRAAGDVVFPKASVPKGQHAPGMETDQGDTRETNLSNKFILFLLTNQYETQY